MPHGKHKRRSAPGAGTIRKKTVSRNGTEYIYWEARFTTGYDPGTGKQIQRSITGKTQREVAQKLRQATAEIDHGIYVEPCRIALGDWMDIWAKTYLVNVKPRTVIIYEDHIRLHIKPALGAIRLEELTTHTIQGFYNGLAVEDKNRRALSPKTIRSIHGVLHSALRKAVQNNYIRFNPSEACTLPRIEKRELKPLDEAQIADFLIAIQGHRFEDIFLVALFTGMREGEVLGLTWDCVDFGRGTILINKQIQLHQEKGMDAYALVSTKNGKARTIAAAPTVMSKLRHRRAVQAQDKLYAGSAWQDTELVFTNALGGHLTKFMVYRDFKKAVASIGGLTLVSMICAIPSQRWPYRMGWISRQSPVCWGTTTRDLPSAPTLTPPGRCRIRRRKLWAASWRRSCSKIEYSLYQTKGSHLDSYKHILTFPSELQYN